MEAFGRFSGYFAIERVMDLHRLEDACAGQIQKSRLYLKGIERDFYIFSNNTQGIIRLWALIEEFDIRDV